MNKRVITRAVFDIESGGLLEQETFLYSGPWASATPAAKALDEEENERPTSHLNLGLLAASVCLTALLFTSALAGTVADFGDEQIPAGSLSGQADEDYWQNPVLPVPATFYLSFPYLPDPEEIPAGSLVPPVTFSGDEDYWINWTNPVVASQYQTLPYLPDATDSRLPQQSSQVLTASMTTFSGTLIETINVVLAASMATFSGILIETISIPLVAGMATFSGSLIKQTNKVLTSGMSTFAGILSGSKVIAGGIALVDRVLGILTTKLSRLLK